MIHDSITRRYVIYRKNNSVTVNSTLASIFIESYTRIQNTILNEREFSESFYQRLLSRDERYRELFKNTDFQQQYDMLNVALFHFYTYSVTKVSVPELIKIGRIHQKMDLNAKDFRIWKECMIETIEDLDKMYNEKVKTAWDQVINDCIDYLMMQE